MKTLKIGIVGVGFIGQRHIEAIRRTPDTEIVAVADIDSSSALRAARELGNIAVYATVEKMIAKESLDVIHNCTPNFMHYDINARIIAAGKHLYCEKPLTLDAAQADDLLRQLGRAPIANCVNFNYRMNAMTQELRERVQGANDGRPLMVTGSYIQDWMLREDDYDWRLDPKAGGRSRAIADIGSHLFDLSQYVLNKKIVAVNASTMIAHPTRTRCGKNGAALPPGTRRQGETVQVENEDAASIMVRFQDGTSGLFQVSQVAAGHKNDMRLRIDLTQASYEWRQEDSDKLYIGKREKANEILYRETAVLNRGAQGYSTLPPGHPEGWNDALCNSMGAFYRSVQSQTYANEGMPYATVADGAWIMKVIEACLESDKAGCWIDVETGGCLQ